MSDPTEKPKTNTIEESEGFVEVDSDGSDPLADGRDDNSARRRLLEAATKLFADHGLDGTSTRDIAKAADLNISLISYYFGGKEGLYKAVISDFALWAKTETERFVESYDQIELNRDTFRELMRDFISRMLPFKFQSRGIQMILQREMMQGLPHCKDLYENIFSKITENIVGIYRKGQAKGFVRSELNPYIVFLSMVHATDIYFQVSRCQTQIERQLLQLPEQMDLYIEQIFMIYVEGVLI